MLSTTIPKMKLANTAADFVTTFGSLPLPADDNARLLQAHNEMSQHKTNAMMGSVESLIEPYYVSHNLLSEHANNEFTSYTLSAQFDKFPLHKAQPKELRVGMGELAVGCVLWLGHQGEHNVSCSRDLCCGMNYLRESGYNHPVVVLSIPEPHSEECPEEPVKPMCSVACVSQSS